MTPAALARTLDHAVLKPELTPQEAREAITLGVDHGVWSVCVRPCDLSLAAALCHGTDTLVSTVLAFPHGCLQPRQKAAEAATYVAGGASEIDMVANYGRLRVGDYGELEAEVSAVLAVTRPAGVLLKVILETGMLEAPAITAATRLCADLGADFVKTSTGFNGGGATDEAVQLMLAAGEGRIRVKPSGGIRDGARATHLLAMGAHRLGVNYSSTPAICGQASATPASTDSY